MRSVPKVDQKIHVELEPLPSSENTELQQKILENNTNPQHFTNSVYLSFMGLEIGTALFSHVFTNPKNKKVTLYPFYFIGL